PGASPVPVALQALFDPAAGRIQAAVLSERRRRSIVDRSIARGAAATLVEPSYEHLHFLLRLNVAGAGGGRNAIAPGNASLRRITGFDQRAPEEFPGGRIGRIEFDRAAQLDRRIGRRTGRNQGV